MSKKANNETTKRGKQTTDNTPLNAERSETRATKSTQAAKARKQNRIRVQFDIEYPGDPGKKMNQDSETIPDMNLTVRQLLENHTRGVNGQVQVRKPLYFEHPIPVINDMTDIDRLRENIILQKEAIDKFIEEEKSKPQEEEIDPNSKVKNPHKHDLDSIEIEDDGQTRIPDSQ